MNFHHTWGLFLVLAIFFFGTALAENKLSLTAVKVPTSRKNEPFVLGPLKIESDLSLNGKYVQIQISLETVIVGATILTADNNEYVFDFLVGTAQTKGKLQAQFHSSQNTTSSIAAIIDVNTSEQTGHYEGDVYQWWEPELPLPSKTPVAPDVGDAFYIGSFKIVTTLQKNNKLHVVVVQADLPLSGFTLSPSLLTTKVNVAIGLDSLVGSISMQYFENGISTIFADLTFNEVSQQSQNYRGGIFYWSQASKTVDNYQVPCVQPFYFGPIVTYNVQLQKIDHWNAATLSIYSGTLLGTEQALLPTSPTWNYNFRIGSTGNNGTAVAYFAPAGEISSVTIDSVLYQDGQDPVRYTGGVYFWIA